MNNILFKAKRLDNGETVYGWPFKSAHTDQWLIIDSSDGVNNIQYLVYEDSIKQWTGLFDINGKEIYDGDKLRCLENEFKWIVKFINASFVACDPEVELDFVNLDDYTFEVAG